MAYVARYEATGEVLPDKPRSTKYRRMEKSTNLLNPD